MQPYHNRNISNKEASTTFEKIERMHPHKMLVFLAIIGSSLIFLFMLIAFTTTYNKIELPQDMPRFIIPKAFIFSTIIIMVSSYFISRIKRAYEEEKMKKLRNMLGITILLGFVFTMSQYWGWHQLEQSGYTLNGITSGAYLYVISGLHILHLVAGIFFLTQHFIQVSGVANDPVRSLVMVTNPYQKLKIEMLSIYWHFVDFLWVGLFLYFLFLF